jgi:hypothetical protein
MKWRIDFARLLQIPLAPKHKDKLEIKRKAAYPEMKPQKAHRQSFRAFWRKSPYCQSQKDMRPRRERRRSARMLWTATK